MASGSRGGGAGLFGAVRFYIHDSIKPTVRQELTDTLVAYGARAARLVANSESTTIRFDLNEITHFITDTCDFPEYGTLSKLPETVSVVLPSWLTRSVDAQKLLPTRFYSPNNALIFAGLCLSSTDLPTLDNLAIQAGVESLGGLWRRELTREVTHLIAIAPHGKKYDAAIEYGPATGMIVVLPHWFEECIKFRQLVSTELYEFPNPLFYRTEETHGIPAAKRIVSPLKSKSINTITAQILGPDDTLVQAEQYQRTAVVSCMTSEDLKKRMGNGMNGSGFLGDSLAATNTTNGGSSNPLRSTATANFPPHVNVPAAKDAIFTGRRVYFASDLGLRAGLEEALMQRISDAGGMSWSATLDGAEVVGASQNGRSVDQWEKRRVAEKELRKANTVVMRTREGWEYWVAYEGEKTIGNLAWLYHVLAISKLASPLDRLLHYPLPPGPIPGADQLELTISNYTNHSRDYVRTMIESLGGATFTGTMAKTATHVITMTNAGQKVAYAGTWKVPCVTHFWLEACIAEWTLVDIHSSPTFTPLDSQAPHHGLLGTTPLLRGSIATWAKRPEVRESRDLALKPIGGVVTDDDEPMMETDLEGDVERDQFMNDDFGGGGQEESADRTIQQINSPKKKELPSQNRANSPVDEMDLSPVIASPKKIQKTASVPTIVKKVVPAVAMDFDTDSSIVVTTKAPKRLATATKHSNESSADEEDEEEEEEVDELDDPSPPHASSSHHKLPPKLLPVDNHGTPPTKKKSKSEITPVKINSSAVKSIPSSHSKQHGIDESLILPLNGRKRAAAGAASENLKHQMLDRNRFEADQRVSSSGRKKRAGSHERGMEDSAAKSRGGKKGKKVVEIEIEDDDEEDSSGPTDVRKKGKRVVPTRVGKKGSVVAKLSVIEAGGSGVVSSFDNSPHPAKGKAVVDNSDKTYYWQTGVLTDDKDDKILEGLGAHLAEMSEKISVLVVEKIARTEKFLLALAHVPYIVTEDWQTESRKKGKLLDPKDYQLVDREGEKKFGIVLQDVLARARAGKVFEGCTFHLTPHLALGREILKRIIEAHGGVAIFTNHATRRFLLEPNVYLISSTADRQKWDSAASTVPKIAVYTSEAVLASAFKQILELGPESIHRCDLQL